MEEPTPPTPGMPRWVKAFVIAGVVVVLLALVSMLVGGGHGPGRHLHHGAAVPAGVW